MQGRGITVDPVEGSDKLLGELFGNDFQLVCRIQSLHRLGKWNKK